MQIPDKAKTEPLSREEAGIFIDALILAIGGERLRKFDMSVWDHCGTSACIGGTLEAMLNGQFRVSERELAHCIGLTYEDVQYLFYGYCLNKGIPDLPSISVIKKHHALSQLAHLKATGKLKDWNEIVGVRND